MFIIKLFSVISLVMIMLLSGCTEVPMRDAPEQPEVSIPVYHKPVVKPDSTNEKYHIVRPGESLKRIAAQYQQNYKDVACWNNLRAPDYNINSGQRLLIDGPSCNHQTVPTATAVPTVTPPAATIMKPKPKAEKGTHIVQEGEQLFVIARRYGKNYRDIAAWNNIKPPFNVRIGQVLRLTPPKISNTPVSKPKPIKPKPRHRNPNYHIVLPGDSLSTLARNYRQKITDLAAWNNLRFPYALLIGQKLRITPPAGYSRKVTPAVPSRKVSKPKIVKPKIVKPSYNSGFHSTSSKYTVKPGETFKSIAKRYGIAVDELADWNGMGPPYTVYPGLTLKLEPPR
jgi:LysM repeat protein